MLLLHAIAGLKIRHPIPPCRDSNRGMCVHTQHVRMCAVCIATVPLLSFCDACKVIGPKRDIAMHVFAVHSTMDCAKLRESCEFPMQVVLATASPKGDPRTLEYDVWHAVNVHHMDMDIDDLYDTRDVVREKVNRLFTRIICERGKNVDSSTLPDDAWSIVISHLGPVDRFALRKASRRLKLLVDAYTPREMQVERDLMHRFQHAYYAAVALGFELRSTFREMACAMVHANQSVTGRLQSHPAGRRYQLYMKLAPYGIAIREDSYVCDTFIHTGRGPSGEDIDGVVDTALTMNFLFTQTRYAEILDELRQENTYWDANAYHMRRDMTLLLPIAKKSACIEWRTRNPDAELDGLPRQIQDLCKSNLNVRTQK